MFLRPFLLTGVALLGAACAPKVWVPPTPGRVEEARPVASVTPTQQVTAADGWRPPPPAAGAAVGGGTAPDAQDGMRAFEAMTRRRSTPVRTVVYFNERLSSALSNWSMPARDVLEVDVQRTGGKGNATQRARVTLGTEFALPVETGSRPIAEALANRLEQAIVRDLLSAGASVRDKGLVVRQAGAQAATSELSAAELAALKKDVDLVVEASLLPSADASGIEVRLRAIATADARILSLVTSSDIASTVSTTGIEAVAGRGYEEVTRTTTVPLEKRLRASLDRVMLEVAARF